MFQDNSQVDFFALFRPKHIVTVLLTAPFLVFLFNLHNLVVACELSLQLILNDGLEGRLLRHFFLLHRPRAHLPVQPLELDHLLLIPPAVVGSAVEVDLLLLLAELLPFLCDELGEFREVQI